MLISSYAKINLFLEVLNKRPDGYHEIETLFSSISLHDNLRFALTKKPQIKILSNIPELAAEDNLVYKVTKRVFSDFGIKTGIEIHLQKDIPLASGLGGGSSNAAMTILALNRLCELGLDESSINKLAAEFGSDVNFFLYGGFAKGTSRGEVLEILPDTETLELILVNPGIRIASSEAYRLADLQEIEPAVKKLWFNRLEAGIRKKYPLIDNVLRDLSSLGAAEAMMSGSGATCIGLFEDKALQDKAINMFTEKRYWAKLVKTMKRSRYKECTQNLSL